MHLLRTVIITAAILVVFAGCARDSEPEPPLLDGETRGLLAMGTRALEANEFDAALALADSAEARNPDETGVDFLRGRIYGEMLQFEKARAAYERVAEEDPDYPGVWNNLGNIAARESMYRQAVKFYEKELEHNPAPVPWVGMGKAFRQVGAVDSAQHAFEQALEADSTYAPAHQAYAQLLSDEGDYQGALEQARAALRKSPGSLNAHFMIGSMQHKLGESGAALPHLKKVAEAWPWHHESYFLMGQAMLRLGFEEEGQLVIARAEELRDQEQEVDYWEQTVRNQRESPFAHAGLATALRRAGRYEDAVHAYRVALRLDSSDVEIMNNLAIVYLLREDTTAAIRTYQRALSVDSAQVDIWLNLGVLHALGSDTADAQRAWRQALAHDPGNADAKRYLARLDGRP